MMHMLIRHKVADFAKWKPVYDAHEPSRQNAGLKEEHLLRNADDPNEVILLFSTEDLDKAKAFTASDDLRQAMQKAGVSDKPDVYFLKD
ncbi:MAG: cyclase [Verrucomicrobia bacterium]|nr:MAG: cyclase [Verrucomicrobiota bacterium]